MWTMAYQQRWKRSPVSATVLDVYIQTPRLFKFALCDVNEFNHSVFVEILYIDKKPILHVVDEATRY